MKLVIDQKKYFKFDIPPEVQEKWDREKEEWDALLLWTVNIITGKSYTSLQEIQDEVDDRLISHYL